ncbi:MAG TPA: threonine ammonia-lyase [Candidatus Protoclostridium stercorigallinarum]|uniref:threonine ammonia-lyase n=1 Tax=Candidatus Protoclostridium stercorigallinarum TaxID=2838741 RepID=A0A9D1PZJ0_9FIRM|nr:threonine ammonia-lyase [Candidatus Protoclostridium stercorigallinarum]
MTIDSIREARERLAAVVQRNRLDHSSTFSAMTGGDVYLKCENLQKTGSFKVRGAYNKIAKLAEEGKTKAIVACSAGNHAQGCAFAASAMGMKATIVMPKTTPIAKINATEGYGAKAELYGDCYDDAYLRAREIEKTEGAAFIHPFDDEEVIAGQGTLGLEMLEEVPDLDCVIVPAGGGGLLAGVALAVKSINPKVSVIGVQAEGAPAIALSFREKKHIATDSVYTIADGIAVKNPGEITMKIIDKYADDVVTVSDGDIASAIIHLIERTKLVVEPAGATPLALLLSGKLNVRGKKVACLLSGGNIDVSTIGKIIDRGLVSRGRKIEFSIQLQDKPGMLEKVSHILASENANVISITYDRMSADLELGETILHIGCEVGGKEHSERVAKALTDSGLKVLENGRGGR